MFGKSFEQSIRDDNINADNVSVSRTGPTSVATILVDNDGHNAIAVNFGATLELGERDVENAEEAIKQSHVLVTSQMVKHASLSALKMAKKHNILTIFNYAPAVEDLSEEYNTLVDLLVVNEVEAEVFTKCHVKSVEDAKKACANVLARDGFHLGVIVTLGEQGVVYCDKKSGEYLIVEAKKVQAVDSTGAGDAFVGSLAHYLSKLGVGEIKRAIELACEYATLSVLKKGTQASYPKLNELDEKFKVV